MSLEVTSTEIVLRLVETIGVHIHRFSTHLLELRRGLLKQFLDLRRLPFLRTSHSIGNILQWFHQEEMSYA